MVSEKDRAHFRAIADGMRELNEDALREDALRDPGENVERGLRLSGQAMLLAREFGAAAEDKQKIPMIVLWRARHPGP